MGDGGRAREEEKHGYMFQLPTTPFAFVLPTHARTQEEKEKAGAAEEEEAADLTTQQQELQDATAEVLALQDEDDERSLARPTSWRQAAAKGDGRAFYSRWAQRADQFYMAHKLLFEHFTKDILSTSAFQGHQVERHLAQINANLAKSLGGFSKAVGIDFIAGPRPPEEGAVEQLLALLRPQIAFRSHEERAAFDALPAGAKSIFFSAPSGMDNFVIINTTTKEVRVKLHAVQFRDIDEGRTTATNAVGRTFRGRFKQAVMVRVLPGQAATFSALKLIGTDDHGVLRKAATEEVEPRPPLCHVSWKFSKVSEAQLKAVQEYTTGATSSRGKPAKKAKVSELSTLADMRSDGRCAKVVADYSSGFLADGLTPKPPAVVVPTYTPTAEETELGVGEGWRPADAELFAARAGRLRGPETSVLAGDALLKRVGLPLSPLRAHVHPGEARGRFGASPTTAPPGAHPPGDGGATAVWGKRSARPCIVKYRKVRRAIAHCYPLPAPEWIGERARVRGWRGGGGGAPLGNFLTNSPLFFAITFASQLVEPKLVFPEGTTQEVKDSTIAEIAAARKAMRSVLVFDPGAYRERAHARVCLRGSQRPPWAGYVSIEWDNRN